MPLILMRFILLIVTWGSMASAYAGEIKDGPAYPRPILFISNLEGGTQNGYITVMDSRKKTFKCGRHPYEVEVTWKFLRRTAKGDLYEMTEISSGGRQVKNVVYNDSPIEIWKVDDRTVIMKPYKR